MFRHWFQRAVQGYSYRDLRQFRLFIATLLPRAIRQLREFHASQVEDFEYTDAEVIELEAQLISVEAGFIALQTFLQYEDKLTEQETTEIKEIFKEGMRSMEWLLLHESELTNGG